MLSLLINSYVPSYEKNYKCNMIKEWKVKFNSKRWSRVKYSLPSGG